MATRGAGGYRRSMRQAARLAALIAAAGCAAAPQDDPTPVDVVDAALAARLQQVLDDGRAALGAPAIVLAVRVPGQGTWIGASGTPTAGGEDAVDPALAFGLGSITKSFVTVLVLDLVDEGALDLDDPVATWLPDLPGADRTTVRHLLSHTSGLANYTEIGAFYAMLLADEPEPTTPDEVIALAAAEGLAFEPGSAWAYSNTGFHVAGRIAEEVTGEPLAGLLEARVLAPHGLDRTWLLGEPARAELAPGHVNAQPAFPIDPAWQWAAGGLASDVGDLVNWGVALLEGEALAPHRARMTVRATALDADGDPAPYGLGLYLRDNGCGPVVGHTGSTMGYQSDLFRTEDGLVVAALQNDFTFEVSDVAVAACLAARDATGTP